MISTSFKPQPETVSISLFPDEPTLDGYRMVFDRNIMPFFTYLGNTVFLAVVSVFGAVISNSLVAYSLSRIRWRGRNLLFALTLAVMMMPGAVTMVPVYVMFSRLNLVGTFVPLLAPSFFGSAFAIFLLRQFFMGLPKSLEDAARIDGCSQIGIYARIFLPLMKPALITVGIFTFTATWNDFLGPLIYLSDDRMYTLQMGLHRLRSMTFIVSTPSLMAMAFLITLPMVILFFFAQRHFVQGITFAGVKA
jgi:multiple sugar transport system permease protein